MAQQDVEEIRQIIRPCGLSPRKSKAIYELSHILVDKYDGEVPKDMDLLEELPGVGHKTASVVMSQAFGIPTCLVFFRANFLIGTFSAPSFENDNIAM